MTSFLDGPLSMRATLMHSSKSLHFSHLINSAHWWLITKSATWTVHIPYRTNSAKLQPIWPDLGALSVISVFQSLTKLSPLLAAFKIGCMNSAYIIQDQLSQISAHLDWFGWFKCHFWISVTPWWQISKSAMWTLHTPFRTDSAKYQPIWTDLGTLSAISVF